MKLYCLDPVKNMITGKGSFIKGIIKHEKGVIITEDVDNTENELFRLMTYFNTDCDQKHSR